MLYIVATPIGNLMDLSYRAIDTLQKADLIAVEDTRKSKILLTHYQINTKTISLHEHNEHQVVPKLLSLLKQGKNIALISDAGTPLISDPGYHLVRKAHLENIPISPIPGPSAVMAAVSASGLAVEQFIFIGFLPAKLSQKQELLLDLALETRTMVFFESPNRIIETIECMQKVFNIDREIAFCRELTKKFETIKMDSIANIYQFINSDPIQQTKGEIVIIVQGNKSYGSNNTNKNKSELEIDLNSQKILRILMDELPLTKAASLTAKITGVPKKKIYEFGTFLPKKN